MKKILLATILLISACTSFAQTFSNPNPGLYGIRYQRGRFDSSLQYSTGCGLPAPMRPQDKLSAIYFDSCGHQQYTYDPSTRAWTASAGGGSTDTTSLSTRINSLKVSYAGVVAGPDSSYFVMKTYSNQPADTIRFVSSSGGGGGSGGTVDTSLIHAQLVQIRAGKQDNITTGSNSQYLRGDLSLATFPTIPAQVNIIAGSNITTSGTYPNITINSSGTGGGVSSISGTTNQIIASGSTGSITLSTPQDIHTGASPTFSGLYLTGLPVSSSSADSALVADVTTGQLKKVAAGILNADTLAALIATGGIVSKGYITSQTAAATICTYTAPNDGKIRQYNINGYVLIGSITTDIIEYDVDYYAGGVLKTLVVDNTLSAADSYPLTVKTIMPDPNSTITVRIGLTGGGTVTYNASGSIEVKAIFDLPG